MRTTRVIPCLDVDAGRVVKGVNFVGSATPAIRSSSPLDTTREGADEVIFLDITASSDGRETMVEVARPHRRECVHPLHRRWRHAHRWTTLGGCLRAGADKVSVNTAAVEQPELIAAIATEFGAQCVVVRIDARRAKAEQGSWEVYMHGGRTPTGLDAVAWAEEVRGAGAGEIMLTSMDRDGTRTASTSS